jgi:hypothetical protein
LSLKIYCISLNWGWSIIICSITPQIWQGYFKGFCGFVVWTIVYAIIVLQFPLSLYLVLHLSIWLVW